MKKLILTIAFFSTILLTACVSSTEKEDDMTGYMDVACTNKIKETSSKKYSQGCIFPADYIANKTVVMETDKGIIKFDLLSEKAPNTVSNFVFLAEQGFYDGLTFHRREDDIFKIIQGGDPSGDGTGGPGYTIKEEAPSSRTDYKKGVVAMAKAAAPKTTGSQFFIMLDDFDGFDPVYSIFGQITEGQDVANKIQIGDKIIKVTIVNK